MQQCLISLGANLGNPRDTMRRAAIEIIDATNAHAVRASQLYRTPPIGGPTGQGDFLNAVLALETELEIQDLREALHAVEAKLGRHRQMRWEARPIDLDILLYSNQRVWTSELKIPHPRMAFRSFVIKPAAEIVPSWRDPVSQMTIGELAGVLEQVRSLVVLTSNSDEWLRNLSQSLSATLDPSTDQEHVIKYSDQVWIAVMPASETDCKLDSLNYILEKARETSVEFGRPLAGILVSLADVPGTIESPLSSTLAWDDALNLTSNNTSSIDFCGPRYLISPCNFDWAVHEIQASLDAMKCFVEPTGETLI